MLGCSRILPRSALCGTSVLRALLNCNHTSFVTVKRAFSTLDPSRLTPHDFVDLSGRKQRSFGQTQILYKGSPRTRVPFPAGTQGFFYYIPGPAHAPIAGELRFRVTTGPDVGSFERGRDLLSADEDGRRPWTIPAAAIFQSTSKYTRICETIMNVDRTVDAALAAAARAGARRVIPSSVVIHSLGQPFTHDLSHGFFDVRVAAGHDVHDRLRLGVPFDGRASQERTLPYTGQVRCAFESVVVGGRPALAVRVLEVVKPVRPCDGSYDGWLPPLVAGELLKTTGGAVWAHHPNATNANFAAVSALLGTSAPTPPAGGLRRRIRNLSPGALAPADWMDLSHMPAASPHIGARLANTLFYTAPYGPPFPAGTAGFFYVHVPAPEHPIGAQLRFRLVPSPDPAHFAAGTDLRTPAGRVWQRAVPALVAHPRGAGLAQILAREGTVPADALRAWRAARTMAGTHAQPVVCPGAPPFVWDFQRRFQGVALGWGAHAVPVVVRTPFGALGRVLPFRGSALVRLEEDEARRRFHMVIEDVRAAKTVPGFEHLVLPGKGVVRLAPQAAAKLSALTRSMRTASLQPSSPRESRHRRDGLK